MNFPYESPLIKLKQYALESILYLLVQLFLSQKNGIPLALNIIPIINNINENKIPTKFPADIRSPPYKHFT